MGSSTAPEEGTAWTSWARACSQTGSSRAPQPSWTTAASCKISPIWYSICNVFIFLCQPKKISKKIVLKDKPKRQVNKEAEWWQNKCGQHEICALPCSVPLGNRLTVGTSLHTYHQKLQHQLFPPYRYICRPSEGNLKSHPCLHISTHLLKAFKLFNFKIISLP